jgi:hypothetical protein
MRHRRAGSRPLERLAKISLQGADFGRRKRRKGEGIGVLSTEQAVYGVDLRAEG